MGHSKRLNNLRGPKTSTLEEQYQRLLIGCEYLRDNWNYCFLLKDTASTSMLSPYHFHRLFKTCFGITPYHYHLNIRMTKALHLLMQKDQSINEVSLQVGFNDTNTFRRSFKKFYGVTPSKYRRIQ